MAFHVLPSELKWLLITFIIGSQEGQNLLPADSFLFLDLFSFVPHFSWCLEASLLMFQTTKQEINQIQCNKSSTAGGGTDHGAD